MLEDIIIGLAVGCLAGIIGAFFVLRRLLSPENIMETLDFVIDSSLKETEMQKKLYTLGLIIGNGIKQGVGIQGGKGKFKLEDIIAQGLGQFLSSAISGQQPQKQAETLNPDFTHIE